MLTAQSIYSTDNFYTAGLVAILFILFLIISIMIYFIFYEFSSEKKIKDAKRVKDNAYQKAFSILDDARKQSLKIVGESTLKAQRLIKDTEAFSQATKVLIEKELKDSADRHFRSLDSTSQGLLEMYKKVISQEEEKNISTLESFSTDLKQELVKEVEEFKDILHRETIETQQMVEQKVNAEFKKTIDEINAYKLKKLKKVDENVFKILVLVSKEVFGKIINLDEHQDLVLKSLQKAKESKNLEIGS